MKRRWSRNLAKIVPLPWFGGHTGFFVLIVASVAMLAFSIISPQATSGLRSGVSDVFAPVLQTIGKPVQDAAVFVRGVTGLAELQAENTRMRAENEKLRDWYQTALVLDAENKSLRDLLNVKLEPQSRYITTRILADSGRSFVKSLLVSSGTKDGVQKGQAVISGEGLVGRVVEVGKNTSRILLITDINSRVPVLVENSSQHAILAGANNNLPSLTHIPAGSEVEEGARIVTSGHGGLFAKGTPIGRVVYDESKAPRVELFADFDRMVYVRVVDKPHDLNLRDIDTQ